MPHPKYFEQIPGVIGLHGSTTRIASITFYPLIRFMGFEVRPLHWHRDSTEPLVLTTMDHSYSGETKSQAEARRNELIARGWDDCGRDGVAGYVHVDDLEKTEGPPPDGAF